LPLPATTRRHHTTRRCHANNTRARASFIHNSPPCILLQATRAHAVSAAACIFARFNRKYGIQLLPVSIKCLTSHFFLSIAPHCSFTSFSSQLYTALHRFSYLLDAASNRGNRRYHLTTHGVTLSRTSNTGIPVSSTVALPPFCTILPVHPRAARAVHQSGVSFADGEHPRGAPAGFAQACSTR
jgi:hypothetical protein